MGSSQLNEVRQCKFVHNQRGQDIHDACRLSDALAQCDMPFVPTGEVVRLNAAAIWRVSCNLSKVHVLFECAACSTCRLLSR
jgi:hypothetical protein